MFNKEPIWNRILRSPDTDGGNAPAPAAAPAPASTAAPAPAATPAPAPSPAPSATPAPTPAPGEQQQLLFQDKKDDNAGDKKDEKKDDKPAEKPTAEDMKKYLTDKGEKLDGKTDEEIAKLYDEKKAAEAAPPAFKLEDIVLPDNMPVPEELKTEVTKFANDHKLTKEQMQAATDLHVKIMQKQLDDWGTTLNKWADETKADPDVGGDKLESNVKACDDLVRKFAGTPEQLAEFQKDLKFLGLGNKLSFIRFMTNIAKATADDTQIPGKTNGDEPKDIANILYPNMK